MIFKTEEDRTSFIESKIKDAQKICYVLFKAGSKEDFESEAYLGLINAVDSFDNKKGKFGTHLFSCIKRRLGRYSRTDCLVKIPENKRKMIDRTATLSFDELAKDKDLFYNVSLNSLDKVEKIENRIDMIKGLKKLTKEEKKILIEYYVKEQTLETIFEKVE